MNFFRSVNGALTYGPTKHPRKFCKAWTLRMEAKSSVLKNHCDSFHEPGIVPQWQGFDETPVYSVYENFEEWRLNPETTEPLMKPADRSRLFQGRK